jgi:anti-anti-sigma regulatory factor
MTLKIQKSVADGATVVFRLSGRIEGAHLAELQRVFENDAEDLRIALDMQDVQLVDRDAVGFLARCEEDGIRLDHCRPYIREWIERERHAK